MERKIRSCWRVTVLASSFCLAALSVSAEDNLSGIRHNNSAVDAIVREDLPQAEQMLLQTMATDPFNPILHLNLGFVFEAQKQYEKARKEYESVLRIQGVPEELRFMAHFNAGNAAAQDKKKEVALAHYQAALDIQPDSIETKTNIELLLKQGGGPSQGQGGGSGDKESQEQKDKQGGQQPNDPQQPQDNQKNEKGNKPKFDSDKLTKEDVRKILDELKSQEKKIRALEYGTKSKEGPPGKDW